MYMDIINTVNQPLKQQGNLGHVQGHIFDTIYTKRTRELRLLQN